MRIVCVLKNKSVTTPAAKRIKVFEGNSKVTFSLQCYNKNTSSTIVYDQSVNRLRKFILVELGASLVLIEFLFTEIYLLVMIRLEQCSNIL
jgi:hypothetical protein